MSTLKQMRIHIDKATNNEPESLNKTVNVVSKLVYQVWLDTTKLLKLAATSIRGVYLIHTTLINWTSMQRISKHMIH